MDPRFLRDEAARFRVMAEESDRPATRLRLLGMAADYEARAVIADGLVKPAPTESAVEPMPDADASEPAQDGPPRVRSDKLTLGGPKEIEVVKRRPLIRRKPI
jgi:hypothetical protein